MEISHGKKEKEKEKKVKGFRALLQGGKEYKGVLVLVLSTGTAYSYWYCVLVLEYWYWSYRTSVLVVYWSYGTFPVRNQYCVQYDIGTGHRTIHFGTTSVRNFEMVPNLYSTSIGTSTVH